MEECGNAVVECLTPDRGVVGSSLIKALHCVFKQVFDSLLGTASTQVNSLRYDQKTYFLILPIGSRKDF